jgi:hypothetical protein
MEPAEGDGLGSAAVTFRISVEDSRPDATMGIIRAVETAFLEGHARSAAKPAVPPRQLEEAAFEVERLAERVRAFEADIELFERRNAAALPELHERNVEALDRASRERLQLDDEIRVLEERRMELDRGLRDIQRGGSQLGRVTRGDDLTAERLIALQSERAVLRGRFGAAYPQVETLSGEIIAFQAAVKERLDSAVSEFQRSREELAALERAYPIDHPDVVRASHRVSALEARVEQLTVRGLTSGERRYIESVSRERREIDGRIETLRAQRQSLQESVTDYEARALDRPALEHRYVRLRDELAAARAELDGARGHAEMLAAQQDLAEQLRPGRLSVVAPAAVVGPLLLSRPGVVAMLGVALASLAIFLVVALIERVDRRVSGSGAIERLIGRPPLADIPFITVTEGSAADALPESIPARLGVTVFIGVTAALLLAGVAADGLERVVLLALGP